MDTFVIGPVTFGKTTDETLSFRRAPSAMNSAVPPASSWAGMVTPWASISFNRNPFHASEGVPGMTRSDLDGNSIVQRTHALTSSRAKASRTEAVLLMDLELIVEHRGAAESCVSRLIVHLTSRVSNVVLNLRRRRSGTVRTPATVTATSSGSRAC